MGSFCNKSLVACLLCVASILTILGVEIYVRKQIHADMAIMEDRLKSGQLEIGDSSSGSNLDRLFRSHIVNVGDGPEGFFPVLAEPYDTLYSRAQFSIFIADWTLCLLGFIFFIHLYSRWNRKKIQTAVEIGVVSLFFLSMLIVIPSLYPNDKPIERVRRLLLDNRKRAFSASVEAACFTPLFFDPGNVDPPPGLSVDPSRAILVLLGGDYSGAGCKESRSNAVSWMGFVPGTAKHPSSDASVDTLVVMRHHPESIESAEYAEGDKPYKGSARYKDYWDVYVYDRGSGKFIGGREFVGGNPERLPGSQAKSSFVESYYGEMVPHSEVESWIFAQLGVQPVGSDGFLCHD